MNVETVSTTDYDTIMTLCNLQEKLEVCPNKTRRLHGPQDIAVTRVRISLQDISVARGWDLVYSKKDMENTESDYMYIHMEVHP